MNVHIHAPPPTLVELRVIGCPTCGRRRRMLVTSYEWYGPHAVCLSCGEQWDDGEMSPRPFARGWRERSIRRARRLARALGFKVAP